MHSTFWLELRQRLETDNSELVWGEATIFIPKLNHRLIEKELAVVEATKLFSHPEITRVRCNQIMIYTAKGGWFVERVEILPFTDAECFRMPLDCTLLKAAELVGQKTQHKYNGFGARSQAIPNPQIQLLKIPKAE